MEIQDSAAERRDNPTLRPRFSLIIPAYNEEKYLPRLLDTVDAARQRYHGGGGAIEVIVADNASTDATAEIASARGCRVAHVEKRVIAAARNGGAAIAHGEVLCFVDADLQIHPDAFNAIDEVVTHGQVIGGATGWKLERKSPGLWATNILARSLLGIARMSGGIVFCRKDAFREIGGYNEARNFAEDVEFFVAMRRLGKKRGQRTVLTTHTETIVSTRKFDAHGDWHMFWMLLWIPLKYRSVRKLVQAYWYDDKSRS